MDRGARSSKTRPGKRNLSELEGAIFDCSEDQTVTEPTVTLIACQAPSLATACAEDSDFANAETLSQLPDLLSSVLSSDLDLNITPGVPTTGDDARKLREGARDRQTKSRRVKVGDQVSLARAQARRKKDAENHRSKRNTQTTLLLAEADDQLARHRNKGHVEKRLDSDCHSCWLLACYECWRTHMRDSRGRCGQVSCKERNGQVRPVKPIDGPRSGKYDYKWGSDAELERIRALPLCLLRLP
jgi:hypothetical protein